MARAGPVARSPEAERVTLARLLPQGGAATVLEAALEERRRGVSRSVVPTRSGHQRPSTPDDGQAPASPPQRTAQRGRRTDSDTRERVRTPRRDQQQNRGPPTTGLRLPKRRTPQATTTHPTPHKIHHHRLTPLISQQDDRPPKLTMNRRLDIPEDISRLLSVGSFADQSASCDVIHTAESSKSNTPFPRGFADS